MFDVRVRLGAVLEIDAADRLLPSDGPVTLWVTGVRLVAHHPPHDEWIWVEGMRLGPSGCRVRRRESWYARASSRPVEHEKASTTGPVHHTPRGLRQPGATDVR